MLFCRPTIISSCVSDADIVVDTVSAPLHTGRGDNVSHTVGRQNDNWQRRSVKCDTALSLPFSTLRDRQNRNENKTKCRLPDLIVRTAAITVDRQNAVQTVENNQLSISTSRCKVTQAKATHCIYCVYQCTRGCCTPLLLWQRNAIIIVNNDVTLTSIESAALNTTKRIKHKTY